MKFRSDKGRGCAKSRFEENIYSRHTNNTMYILCSHRIGMKYGQAGPRGPTILAMPTINTPDIRRHARFVYILIIDNKHNKRAYAHAQRTTLCLHTGPCYSFHTALMTAQGVRRVRLKIWRGPTPSPSGPIPSMTQAH